MQQSISIKDFNNTDLGEKEKGVAKAAFFDIMTDYNQASVGYNIGGVLAARLKPEGANLEDKEQAQKFVF